MAGRASRGTGVQAPRLDDVDPQGLRAVDAAGLGERETHDGELFDGGDVSGADLQGSTFTECRFDGVTLGGALLRGSRFVDTVLADPFAPELSAARTTWKRVRVDRPRWGSAELFDAEFEGALIQGGKIDYLNLRQSQLTDVVIEGCSIGELDLGGVTATRVALRDCRLGTLDLTRATLSSFDLRGATFDRLDGVDGLRGAVVDEYQLALLAPLLAAQSGLVVA
ncbi:pentapeptide repeat-containing protein [Frondihabitans australicus]|uniref:Uncharacterized protein YjbI with pentapeptide repeats n=1 Tax=Frondihabitans australicus TaxID=386892 RepID=A0A495IAJ6_9MICO|nr:pentapeptide repeat-containing protein [Frondihabitans australicus]RKR73029.1 uncharacterized protein YjbI with pentapeptide repeats [Frondihabitans australicus]